MDATLTSSAATAIPATICTAQAPPGVHLSLHIFDDQYLLQYNDEGRVVMKFVNPFAVRQAFLQEAVDTGWLPVGAVRWGTGIRGTWAVRYDPPTARKIVLDLEGQAGEQITIPVPATVFVGRGTSYGIWAVKGAHFSPLSALYHLPMPNVDESGEICFGSNGVPSVAEGGMEKAHEIFWRAPFNDHHRDKKSKAYPLDVREQLRRLAAEKARRYPARDLVKVEMNVDSMIRRLTYANY